VTTLVLPDPSVVVLVGASGSGKSTLAGRLFDPAEVLSSDGLRADLTGSEADQRASGVAFRILHRTLERRAQAGQLTVVDATSVRAEHRRPLWQRARAAGLPTVAIVLDLPPAEILARNAGRAGRVVPVDIVERQLEALRHTMDAGRLIAESVDHVVVLRSIAAVATFRCERRPTGPSGRRPSPAPVDR
jgi:protein phosphatase